jgi:hypothetical protein
MRCRPLAEAAMNALHSPFPGMDPYLEDQALWPEFHRRFTAALRDQIVTGCVARYHLLLGQHDNSLELRERSDGRLVTLVNVLALANKTTAAGRQAYREQRRQARDAGANLVEIDLLLQGQPPLDYDRAGLPPWDYSVTVQRATQPERFEIYTSMLEKQLPRFRLPLAADDRDTVADLQTVFTRCYDEGRYFERIDYGQEPGHEQIASVAYSLWRQDECPDGRDREHWSRALARLQPWKRVTAAG